MNLSGLCMVCLGLDKYIHLQEYWFNHSFYLISVDLMPNSFFNIIGSPVPGGRHTFVDIFHYACIIDPLQDFCYPGKYWKGRFCTLSTKRYNSNQVSCTIFLKSQRPYKNERHMQCMVMNWKTWHGKTEVVPYGLRQKQMQYKGADSLRYVLLRHKNKR